MLLNNKKVNTMNKKDIVKLLPTPTQYMVINEAQKRDDYSVHPLPSNLKGASGVKVVNALINKGFITKNDNDYKLSQFGKCFVDAIININGEGVYRLGKEDMLNALEYTLEVQEAVKQPQKEEIQPSKKAELKQDSNPKKSKKSQIVLDLVSERGGADVEEILKATDWKPHSLRSWVSRFNKKQKEEGSPDRIKLINTQGNRSYSLITIDGENSVN